MGCAEEVSGVSLFSLMGMSGWVGGCVGWKIDVFGLG